MKEKIRFLFKNNVFKNGIIFTFFSFLNSGISFLLLFILAKYLSPSGYGELYLFNTLITLLTILISLNSTGIISVDFFKLLRVDFRRVLNTVLIITTGNLLVLLFVFYVFSENLEKIFGITISYQSIALLICYFQVFSGIILDIWRLEEKPLSYGFYSSIIVLLNTILSLFFILCLHFNWEGRVYAQLIVGVLFFVISIYFLIRKKYLLFLLPTKNTFYDVCKFGIPLIPHNASFWLRQGVDRYIINYFYSSISVGVFSFSFNFANIIQLFGTAFNATNSVFIYKEISQGDPIGAKKELWKHTKYLVCFFFILTLSVIFLAIILIPILFPNYIDSIKYLFPLCLGAMFQCIYLLFVNYLFFFKRTKQLMYITFSISLFHVIASLLLTKYSIMFTAYISLFSNMFISLAVFLYSQKVYKLL